MAYVIALCSPTLDRVDLNDLVFSLNDCQKSELTLQFIAVWSYLLQKHMSFDKSWFFIDLEFLLKSP